MGAKIMNRKIRWGLLGAGKILDRWMKGARQIDDMEIVAVASRTRESAAKTAEKFQIPEVLTYEEMLAREDITLSISRYRIPHIWSWQSKLWKLESLYWWKNRQVSMCISGAKKNQVFLMEAVWTRFFPLIKEIEAHLKDIGDVRVVSTNFSFRNEDMTSRLMDPNRAGGSLLDVGVYDLHFTKMILKKEPIFISGVASMDTDEHHLQVDEQAAWIAQYDKGELGLMCSAIRTDMIDTAYIYGT